MKEENKIPLDEVHRRLNKHLGEQYPADKFKSLMWAWRKTCHKPTAGKEGWLSPANTHSLLEYAHTSHPKKVYI